MLARKTLENKMCPAETGCVWARLTPALGSYLFPMHIPHCTNTQESLLVLTLPCSITCLQTINKIVKETRLWNAVIGPSLPTCSRTHDASPCHGQLAVNQVFPQPALLGQSLCPQPWKSTNRNKSSSDILTLESENWIWIQFCHLPARQMMSPL